MNSKQSYHKNNLLDYKKNLHSLIDPMWQKNKITRDQLYTLITLLMPNAAKDSIVGQSISSTQKSNTTHISFFDERQCLELTTKLFMLCNGLDANKARQAAYNYLNSYNTQQTLKLDKDYEALKKEIPELLASFNKKDQNSINTTNSFSTLFKQTEKEKTSAEKLKKDNLGILREHAIKYIDKKKSVKGKEPAEISWGNDDDKILNQCYNNYFLQIKTDRNSIEYAINEYLIYIHSEYNVAEYILENSPAYNQPTPETSPEITAKSPPKSIDNNDKKSSKKKNGKRKNTKKEDEDNFLQNEIKTNKKSPIGQALSFEDFNNQYNDIMDGDWSIGKWKEKRKKIDKIIDSGVIITKGKNAKQKRRILHTKYFEIFKEILFIGVEKNPETYCVTKRNSFFEHQIQRLFKLLDKNNKKSYLAVTMVIVKNFNISKALDNNDDNIEIITHIENSDWNALMVAAYYKPEAIKHIIELINKIEDKNKKNEITEKMLERISRDKWNVLMITAQHSSSSIKSIIELINTIDDIDQKNKIIEKMLTHTNKDNWNALMIAVMNDSSAIKGIIELIKKIDNTNQKNEIIKKILNQKNNDDCNIFSIAAKFNPSALQDLAGLIDKNSPIIEEILTNQDKYSFNPLMLTATYNSSAIKHIVEIIDKIDNKDKKNEIIKKMLTQRSIDGYNIIYLVAQFDLRASIEDLIKLTNAITDSDTKNKTIQTMLENVDISNWNALMVSAGRHPSIIKCIIRLLNEITDIDAKNKTIPKMLENFDKNKLNSLTIAVIYNESAIKDIITLLDQLPEDQKKKTIDALLGQKDLLNGFTVLMMAASRKPSIIQSIINIIDTIKDSATRDSTIQEILEQKQEQNNLNSLMMASYFKTPAIKGIIKLTNRIKNPDKKNETIQKILEKVDNNNWNALIIAARHNPSAVQDIITLTNKITNPDKKNETIQKMLMCLDKNGYNALIIAARHNPSAIQDIIKLTNGITNLDKKHETIQKMLTASNQNNWNALMISVCHSQNSLKDIIKLASQAVIKDSKLTNDSIKQKNKYKLSSLDIDYLYNKDPILEKTLNEQNIEIKLEKTTKDSFATNKDNFTRQIADILLYTNIKLEQVIANVEKNFTGVFKITKEFKNKDANTITINDISSKINEIDVQLSKNDEDLAKELITKKNSLTDQIKKILGEELQKLKSKDTPPSTSTTGSYASSAGGEKQGIKHLQDNKIIRGAFL